MNGDVLLRGTDERHTRVFEVFDYRNCSNHQIRRGLVVLPREGYLPHVHAIRIMPYDRFLVVTDGVLQLFKIPELSDVPSTSLHSSSGLGSPLWTYNFHLDWQAEAMKALVGFHRGVCYDSRAELVIPYLTTFEVPGNKSVARELAGSGMCGSNGPELLSFHLASYTRLQEATTRWTWYFDETSGRILIPTRRDHNTLMMLEFA